MKSLHALVILDYEGPDPRIPNVHAFGFMEVEERDFGVDLFGSDVEAFDVATELASVHWLCHMTYTKRADTLYQVQHVFSYEPATLIQHLFNWGVDMSKFDPTLPRSV